MVRHSRKHPRRASRSGFTLLEVMMALTVLAIGMLGVVALQTSTIGATQDANSFAIANTVARTWIQRLQRDAQRWNHPSAFSASSDIGDTAWLVRVTDRANQWVRPDPTTLEPLVSPGFDRMGNDVPVSDTTGNLIYCTNVRLRQLYPDMLRAEVRVFWKKRRMANYAAYAAHGFAENICTLTASGALDDLGKDDQNFHWTYAVTGITKARAQ